MNPSLAGHPAYKELRQLVAELSLISHVAGTSYDGKVARDTTDDIGGRRPPGTDIERKPRAPRSPLIEGDAQSEKEWDEYGDDLMAWRVCYQRRTPAYFAFELARCETEYRLGALRDEARETLKAWKRMPLPRGQEPEYGSPQWKRYVAESPLDGGTLARKFNVTRQHIYRIRKGYRDAA